MTAPDPFGQGAPWPVGKAVPLLLLQHGHQGGLRTISCHDQARLAVQHLREGEHPLQRHVQSVLPRPISRVREMLLHCGPALVNGGIYLVALAV